VNFQENFPVSAVAARKVGPAGTCPGCIKTCVPAVPRQLAGRWAEGQQQTVDTWQQKNLIW